MSDTERTCSFCDKPQSAVTVMVGFAKRDAHICSECAAEVMETLFKAVNRRPPLWLVRPSDAPEKVTKMN
jgi:hypothetical protein